MPVDSNIYAQFAPPAKSIADYQNDNVARQHNQLLTQVAQQGYDQKQRDIAETNALRALLSQPTFNRQDPDVSAQLYAVAPGQADKVLKSWTDSDKAREETADKAFDRRKKTADAVYNLMSGANDPASWAMARQGAISLGAPPAVLPEQYDPAIVEKLKNFAVTQKERVEQQLKQRELGLKNANDLMTSDGNGGYVPNDPLIAAKNQIAKSGASNTNITNKVDANLGKDTVAQFGPMMKDSYHAAMDAQRMETNAEAVMRAVDSGKVFAGPGATLKMSAAQLADTLGIAGKDTQDKMIKTRAVVQAMAQSALDARSQLRGQGAITEGEQAIINKVAAGDIDNLTPSEIRYLAEVNFKAAQQKISDHESMLDRMGNHPATAEYRDLFALPPRVTTAAPAPGQVRGPASKPPVTPANAPVPTGAPKTVVRTGRDKGTGRKVVVYSDGSAEYAD